MLSKTHKKSPIRLAAGVIGVGALSLAALGLTASGTQAAETIKSKVEAATGIALSGQDAPPPPQDAPPPPKAPKAANPPAAPDAPDAPDGKRRVYRLVSHVEGDGHGNRGSDGKGPHGVMIVNGERIEMPEMPSEAQIAAMVPDVSSANCRNGKGQDMVVETPAQGNRRGRIVICTNRIQAQAGEARRIAIRSRDMGMRSALIGLEHARREVEQDTSLSAGEKADALHSIDQAIRHIRRNTDKDD